MHLTGARQTGKTTLVQSGFPDYTYISLEDPLARPEYSALSAAQWRENFPIAILDEVQKAPGIIESIKATYDIYPETKYILLGSSQILLMEKVRESLAGRVALVELYPLTLPEMMTTSWEDNIIDSRMIQWLKNPGDQKYFNGIPIGDERYAKTSRLMEKYLQFGAMPTIIDDELDENDKFDWLYDYIQTYLQRDIRDLANLRDLEPFVERSRCAAEIL